MPWRSELSSAKEDWSRRASDATAERMAECLRKLIQRGLHADVDAALAAYDASKGTK